MTDKYKRLFGLLFALGGVVLLTGAALMKTPPAIPLPEGVSKDRAQEVVLAAIAYRGWEPGKIENHALVATLAIRKHMIKVIIDFSGDAVSFRYKDSINMKYLERSGLQYIHGNYNTWTKVLADDIAAGLQKPPGASTGE